MDSLESNGVETDVADARTDVNEASDREQVVEKTVESTDAFGALGHEARTEILEALLERIEADGPSRMTFSELFEASSIETTAGFSYHLDQLVGPVLRKVDPEEANDEPSDDERRGEGYEFTYAGLKIARAIQTGAYTRRIDSSPLELSDPCPFCSGTTLEARTFDNVVTIACRSCERPVLRLQFPPSGLESHGDRLPAAFDRHHRYRLSSMGDGVCPECGGFVETRLSSPSSDVLEVLEREEEPIESARTTRPRQTIHACQQCGHELRCPVTLSVLEHPAVIAFYHDHGIDVRDRPLWNVGNEWAETTLSTDPPCVRVVTELGSEVLALYVDGAGRVVDTQRTMRTS